MKSIIIKTQKQMDALPDTFHGYTIIKIVSRECIYVKKARGNSSVEAWGNSSVEAWENSSVVARGNSSVVARENSSVAARENSSVVARENSSVEAWENSSVVARGNSSVAARENSSVAARENSSVVARENSSVEAWGNSSVAARENSSVVARENSSVVARGNSSVAAWGRTTTQIFSNEAVVLLFAFAVAIVSEAVKHKIKKKSKNAYIQIVKQLGWFENNGIKKTKVLILYKRVSKDFKTQEGEENETLWSIGSTVTHKNYCPENSECGEGKFHACSRPYFADEFRDTKGDKYIAIKVKLEDTYEWKYPSYPHKIGFRAGKVMYECDKFGKKLEV